MRGEHGHVYGLGERRGEREVAGIGERRTVRRHPGRYHPDLEFRCDDVAQGNRYQAVFTNALGSVTTAPALLTVNTAPVVTSISGNANVLIGETVMFTASASADCAVGGESGRRIVGQHSRSDVDDADVCGDGGYDWESLQGGVHERVRDGEHGRASA